LGKRGQTLRDAPGSRDQVPIAGGRMYDSAAQRSVGVQQGMSSQG
jgi:hypothetical protein